MQLIVTSFLPAYAASHMEVPKIVATNTLIIAAFFSLVTLAFVARRIDGKDRRRYTFTGGLLIALWAFPAFALTAAWGGVGLIIAVSVGYSAVMGHYAALASLLADLFPVQVRYTGISLCYQISAIIIGGLMPILVSTLVGATNGAFWPAAVILILCGLITMVSSRAAHPSATTGSTTAAGQSLTTHH